MSDVINRTTRTNGELDQKDSVNTPDYIPPKSSAWIVDPDLSALGTIPKIYWKVTGDLVLEMTQLEKDAVDTARLVQYNTNVEATIKARLNPPLPLAGIPNSVVVIGLLITVNINSIVVDDTTTVVADVTLTKTVKVCYIYNSTSDDFSIQVFEKTDGLYGSVATDEQIAADFGEWSVVANGVDLVPV